MTAANREELAIQLIGRLAIMRDDCQLVINTIRRDGPMYDNLHIITSNYEKYRDLVQLARDKLANNLKEPQNNA
jgi:hypothetical protein